MMENSKPKTTACLTQIYGENISRKFKLMCSKVTIGRSLNAEIRLLNPNISRNHCILQRTEYGWTITDNKSQNGTYISGRKLEPGQSESLQCGDILFLGPPSEMPEAFCYDDSFVDDEDMPETGHEIIEIRPLKRPAEEDKNSRKKSNLSGKNPDAQANVLPSAASVVTLINKANKNDALLKSAPSSEPLCQQKNMDIEKQTPSSFLNRSDSGFQIHEISSTANDQAEESLSLLEKEKNDVAEPSSSNSSEDTKVPLNDKDSEILKEIELLKTKLAFMTEQKDRIEQSKIALLKQYEIACEKYFALDQKLTENKKIIEDQQAVQDKVKKKLTEELEEDLICNICTELFIKPNVLNCSHTFCLHCIKQWKVKKNECPICRSKISLMMPCLTLEHIINKIVTVLTPEQNDRRKELIKERETPKKVTTPSSKRRKGSYRRHISRNARIFPNRFQSTVNQPAQVFQSTVNQPAQVFQSTINQSPQVFQSTVNQSAQILQSTVNQTSQVTQSTVNHSTHNISNDEIEIVGERRQSFLPPLIPSTTHLFIRIPEEILIIGESSYNTG